MLISFLYLPVKPANKNNKPNTIVTTVANIAVAKITNGITIAKNALTIMDANNSFKYAIIILYNIIDNKIEKTNTAKAAVSRNLIISKTTPQRLRIITSIMQNNMA